ncbi:hypothetical protein SCAR479_05239 [Seiridium cardinale]|uniref:Carboxylesterase n=1 Tax=Seiridium cardinale TaxID=138064 RepID=A0ABR2XVR8_9PEZI
MWSLAIIVDFLDGARKVIARWVKYRREVFLTGGQGSRSPAKHHTVPELPSHTLFCPVNLVRGERLPLLVWANGFGLSWGLMFGDFLREIASHGYIIIANGSPGGLGSTDESGQLRAVEWALQAPKDSADIRNYIDSTKIALAGQSKGAIHTYIAASALRNDSRVKSLGIFNSGLMRRRPRDMDLVTGLVTSIYYFAGDQRDVLRNNAEQDWELVPGKLSAYFASLNVGHLGTFYEAAGGLFADAAVNWLNYELKGDVFSKQRLLDVQRGWKVRFQNL